MAQPQDGTDRPLPCGVGGNVGRRRADQCAIPGEVQTYHAGSNQGPTSGTIMEKDRRAPSSAVTADADTGGSVA